MVQQCSSKHVLATINQQLCLSNNKVHQTTGLLIKCAILFTRFGFLQRKIAEKGMSNEASNTK